MFLQNLEVSSEFDLKELLFRNLANALGPNSDITVVTRWISEEDAGIQTEEGEDTENSQLVFKILLLDPFQVLAEEAVLTLESGEQVS